jgi:hypothetical protein
MVLKTVPKICCYVFEFYVKMDSLFKNVRPQIAFALVVILII